MIVSQMIILKRADYEPIWSMWCEVRLMTNPGQIIPLKIK